MQNDQPFALQPRNKQPAPKTVLELLQNDGFRDEIAKVLPKHIKPERMLRVALTTAKLSDKLQKCSVQSFASAMLKCSQYGLEPDGRHAHMIPFKSGRDAQGNDIYDLNLIFDYKGLVSLVRRSGDVADITADVVFEEDEFACEKGNNAILLHRPNFKSKNRTIETVYAIYSFVRLKDGTPSFDVMTVDEVNRIRDRSQGYIAAKKYNKQSPWDTDWIEMAKKTVFRRHSKWLPLSPEVKDAIVADDDNLDEKFANARKIEATVLPPDLSSDAQPEPAQDAPEPQHSADPTSEPENAPQSEPESTAPPAGDVPNPTLGEAKPKKQKPAPEPGSRDALVAELKAKIEQNSATETEFIKAALDQGFLTASTRALSSLGSDVLRSLLENFPQIINGI